MKIYFKYKDSGIELRQIINSLKVKYKKSYFTLTSLSKIHNPVFYFGGLYEY
jgi:hypothetical protein